MSNKEKNQSGIALPASKERAHQCEFNTQELKSIVPRPSLVLVHDAKRRGYDPYNTADRLLAPRQDKEGGG